jgi:hypothetical protein
MTKVSAHSSKKSVHVSSAAHVASAGSSQPEAPSASSSAVAATPAPVSNAPSSFAARVTAAVAAIEQARSLLGLDGAVLSASAKKRSLRLKKGGEAIVPTLASLGATYGVEVPSRPTADMTASLQQATELEPARAAITALATIVDGAYFSSRSDTWSTATSLYSMLKKGAPREPKLAAALEPLQEFFSRRHPSATVPKDVVAKQATAAQAKVAKKVAKLQAQLAKLQGAPAAAVGGGAQEAPATAAAVVAPTNGTGATR